MPVIGNGVNRASPSRAAADFDDDGCITLSDLALLLSNYGYGPW